LNIDGGCRGACVVGGVFGLSGAFYLEAPKRRATYRTYIHTVSVHIVPRRIPSRLCFNALSTQRRRLMTPRSEIIHANPIHQGLDGFHDVHALVPTDEGNIVADDECTVSSMIDLDQF